MATLRRSLSSYGGFADGIIVRGMPLLTLYPGNVYWVDSNGGGGSRGTFAHPVLTLAAAFSLVTSDNGDIIVIKPGHAETVTATIELTSKSGFSVVGLGCGDNRPTFTCGFGGASDYGFDIDGDDVVVHNLKWADANPSGGSAATVFNLSGSNITIQNCYIELGGVTMYGIYHDTTLQYGINIVGNTFVGTEAGPDWAIKFALSNDRSYIAGNYFLFEDSVGIDSGVVIYTSGAGIGHVVEENVVLGMSDANIFLVQTVAQPMSLCSRNRIVGEDATDHLGATTAGGFGFIDNMVVQEATSVPGTVDNAGDPIALTPAA